MPELNEGYLQGEILPFYLAVRAITGEPVPQPEGYPIIDISYQEADTGIRRAPVRNITMTQMDEGVWFYIWRIPRREPPVEHLIIMRAILDEQALVASDQSFLVTNQLKNPTFSVKVNILKNEGLFLPEVMEGGHKMRRRQLTEAYQREVDIGLDDYAIEGVDRIAAEYPNRIVDRRVAGRFVISGYAGRFISSETPGGGNQRLKDPNIGVTYTQRKRYRY